MSGDSREPGWYPDRNDPAFNRYWNGRAWTARRHPVGVPLPAVAVVDAVPPGKPPSDGSSPKRRLPIWLWVIGGLMVARSIVGVVAAFDGPDAASSTAVSNPTSASTSAVPHPSPS